MSKDGIYIQPINYPTVPRGQELLRLAPTPHHTYDMMEHFVDAALRVWLDHGLELKNVETIECNFCKLPLNVEVLTAGHHSVCDGRQCDYFRMKAARP